MMKSDIVMMMVGHAGHIHRRTANELLEQRGVSWGQPPILKYLSEHDGCIQRDLAENCHVKAATISSVLDNMESSGYIERRTVPEDRRAQRIFLTDAGREKHELTHLVFEELEEKCMDGISANELAVFKKTLKKIIDNLQVMSGEREA